MAKWRYTIDIKESWALAQDETISTSELVRRILPTLKAVPAIRHDIIFQERVERFENLLEDYGDDIDTADFDEALSDLYDWADDRKVWIATVL